MPVGGGLTARAEQTRGRSRRPPRTRRRRRHHATPLDFWIIAIRLPGRRVENALLHFSFQGQHMNVMRR